MEPFPDLSTLTDEELSAAIREREEEESRISYRRRLLHGRIDILRAEHVARLKRQVAGGGLEPHGETTTLERPLFEGTGEVPEEHEIEPMPDLDTLETPELRGQIHELEREEDDISLRRRVLHGQIDLLRAERARRAKGGGHPIDAGDVAAIFTGHEPPER